MKALRGLYVAVVYILSIPLWVIYAIGMVAVHIVWCARDGWDIRDFMIYQAAFYGGMRIGHRRNVYWVKYGSEHCMEKYLEEIGLE